MPKKPTVSGLRKAMKKNVMQREVFLSRLDAVVPWTRFPALIEPH